MSSELNIPISQQYAIGIDVVAPIPNLDWVNHRGDISYHGAILTHKHDLVGDFIDELHEALQPAINEAGGEEFIRVSASVHQMEIFTMGR
jgi:glucokinase